MVDRLDSKFDALQTVTDDLTARIAELETKADKHREEVETALSSLNKVRVKALQDILKLKQGRNQNMRKLHIQQELLDDLLTRITEIEVELEQAPVEERLDNIESLMHRLNSMARVTDIKDLQRKVSSIEQQVYSVPFEPVLTFETPSDS